MTGREEKEMLPGTKEGLLALRRVREERKALERMKGSESGLIQSDFT